MTKRINFENTLNTRDLGGYPIEGGGYTVYNRFWRSDAPRHLCDSEIDVFLSQNITTVVDLRGTGEIVRQPCFLSDVKDFSYFNIPLDGEIRVPEREEDVPDQYMDMIRNKSAMAQIMKVFAETASGVLFHCAAGKDRTGVVAVLLLLLARVPREDIIADYQVSGTYIEKRIAQSKLSNPALPPHTGLSRPEYIKNFLPLFFELYPTVEDYMRELGLSSEQISSIRDKLISP